MLPFQVLLALSLLAGGVANATVISRGVGREVRLASDRPTIDNLVTQDDCAVSVGAKGTVAERHSVFTAAGGVPGAIDIMTVQFKDGNQGAGCTMTFDAPFQVGPDLGQPSTFYLSGKMLVAPTASMTTKIYDFLTGSPQPPMLMVAKIPNIDPEKLRYTENGVAEDVFQVHFIHLGYDNTFLASLGNTPDEADSFLSDHKPRILGILSNASLSNQGYDLGAEQRPVHLEPQL